jgi:hypothetical protein
MLKIDNPELFFQKQKQFSSVPFTQSEGWYYFQKNKGEVMIFFTDDLTETKIACWGREHKIPFIGKKILQIEGECYKSDMGEIAFRTFFTNLSDLPYAGIEINSNNIYLVDFEIGIRRAGFLRPIALHSCPLSIEIDLNTSINFDRNWRRNLKKAQESQLSFIEVEEFDDGIIENIVQIFKEMSELKKLKYLLEKESLAKLLSSADIRTFIVKNKGNKTIAARIIHEHNRVLSDVFAANSNEARECGATYFLMDNILDLLKRENKLKFDFGRIPPSNNATDSIYLFKNATRGRRVQYNGEWVLYKKKWIEYLMFLYKQFVIKKQRY